MTIREALEEAGLPAVEMHSYLERENVTGYEAYSSELVGRVICGNLPILGTFPRSTKVHSEFKPVLVGNRETLQPEAVVYSS